VAKRESIKREDSTPDTDKLDILRTEGLLLSLCFGNQGLGRIIEHEVAELRKGFDYENSSGVERALIDRVVLCWMRLQKWEFTRTSFDVAGSHPKADIEFVEKHLHLAHARYLGAIEELAKVRFLMSRTNPTRLAAVRAAMKPEVAPQQEPGKLLEMKAG
jgi:hypothetical protein